MKKALLFQIGNDCMRKEDLIAVLQSTLEQGIELKESPILVDGDVLEHLTPFMGRNTAMAFDSVHRVLKEIRVAQLFNGRGLALPNYWALISLSAVAGCLLIRTKQTGDSAGVVRDFYDFLRTNAADCLYVTALAGFEPAEKISLDVNLSLMPFDELPESSLKKQLVEIRLPLVGMMSRAAFRQPSAALVFPFRLQPALVKHDDRWPVENIDLGESYLPKSYGEVVREIGELCRLLTVVGPSPVTTIVSWTQIEASNPMSAMAGGYSSPMHEIDPYPPWSREGHVHRVDSEDVLNVVSAYRSLSKSLRDALHIPLDRLNLAMRREKPEDQAIELGIALESLLLDNVEPHSPLSYQLRLRGAWLHGGTKEEREGVYALLYDIYDLRSKAAHGGRLKVKDRFRNGRIMQTADRLWEGMELCALLIRSMIERKKRPNWKKLVLEPDQKVVESDESVVILCRGTLFEEEVARCGPKSSVPVTPRVAGVIRAI